MNQSILLRLTRLLFAGVVMGIYWGTFSAAGYSIVKGGKLYTTGSNQVSVTFYSYANAWVIDNPPNPECRIQQIKPANQTAPGYAIYSQDQMPGLIPYNEGTNKDFKVPATMSITNLPDISGLGTYLVIRAFTLEYKPQCGPSFSDAVATLSAHTNPVNGTNVTECVASVSGGPNVVNGKNYHKGWAFSTSAIQAESTNLTSGHLALFYSGSATNLQGEAKANKCTVKDPVAFSVRDLVTGAVTNGVLFDWAMEKSATGSGDISWDDNHVQITAPNASFHVNLPGQFTSVAGQLNLEVRNGLVVTSDTSGIYLGALPPVGTPLPLDIVLSTNVEFDFDFTGLSTNDVDVSLYIACSGSEYDEYNAAPVPLALVVATNTPTLSWPANALAWQLQKTPNLGPTSVWADVFGPMQFNDGIFSVTLPADTADTFFRLRSVSPACNVEITQQPLDIHVGDGGLATFSVMAASSPPGSLSYQWQAKYGDGNFIPIPGATDSSYSKTAYLADDGSQYRCLVTSFCSYALSEPATLSVP